MSSIKGKNEKDLDIVKGKLVDLFFWFYAVFMWFAFSASMYRAVDTGLTAAHISQGAMVVIFLFIFLFRKRLSIKVKTYTIVLITLFLGVGGLLNFGLVSTGMYFLFVFVTLSLFLLGHRQGIVSFVIALCFFIFVSIIHYKEIIVFTPINPNFHNSISAWLMAIMVFVLITIMMYYFWKQLYAFLINKVESNTTHDEQLGRINKLLSREIESRKVTEKELEQQFEESRTINDEYQLVNKELLHANDKLEESNKLLTQANDKSQAAERLKSAFLDNMSHEVRTPLNAIVGFTSLLSNDELQAEERHKYLEIVQASTTNLLAVMSDIVNIAKIQSNQYSIMLVEFEINQLLDEILERYTREIFINKGDTVSFVIENKLNYPSVINTDIECIKMILNKLLDNAMKFTKCGSIKLICQIESSNLLKIDVVDTGIGIPEDKSQVIFDTFNQADTTETRKYGGTGLGLSIVKGLTELLCGKITFTTQVAEGTTFSVTIPVILPVSESK